MEKRGESSGELDFRSVGLKTALGDHGVRPDSFLTIRTTDLTPRFLDFYRAAGQPGVGPEERWALWRERYGFAAVPPTAQGMAMARREIAASHGFAHAVHGRMAGLDREAYFTGWILVGHLLDSGWTLPALARVPRGLMARVVEEGLTDILEPDQ